MVLTRKVELENYRKAVTHGTCWTDDVRCNECTSLPMCNLVNKLLDEIEQLEVEEWKENYLKINGAYNELRNDCIQLHHKTEQQQTALDKATQLIINLQSALDYLQEESGVISRDIDSQYIQAAREFIAEIDKSGGGQG